MLTEMLRQASHMFGVQTAREIMEAHPAEEAGAEGARKKRKKKKCNNKFKTHVNYKPGSCDCFLCLARARIALPLLACKQGTHTHRTRSWANSYHMVASCLLFLR